MISLVEYWKRFEGVEAPYLHPDDKPVLETLFGNLADNSFEGFDDAVRSRWYGRGGSEFNFSLYPEPYAGDLERGDIFVLLLNPGLEIRDFYAFDRSPEWRDYQSKNLHQKFPNPAFPNHNLNPEFCWTGAYNWWERKFRKLAAWMIEEGLCGTYFEALSELSRRVVSVELVPYHSTSFKWVKRLGDLPSVKASQIYLWDTLCNKAASDEIALVIARRRDKWFGDRGIPKEAIIFDPANARSASLWAGEAGDRITRQLQKRDGPWRKMF